MPTFFVTTAIPYVNSEPHVGFALEALIADVIARYRRRRGDDVRLLTGTDDNSFKSVQAAEREQVPVDHLVARYSARFEALRDVLGISADDFIRTSVEERHIAGTQKLWRACADAGDVYRDRYKGLYCVGCEAFLDDDELQDGLCPRHHAPPELVEEENWFFRLSGYGDKLRELIESEQLRIVPESRRNEVLSFIRSGLRDFSISRSVERSRGWGVPVPDDPTQVMYVWFDALGNYITALDYADDGPLSRYWNQSAERVHVIGKDIVRFHAVYWPAMLLSAGLGLPTTILTHGFVTIDGRKISKSLGNVIDPFSLVEEFGVDAVRYFLLRHIRTTEDGDFTRERFIRARDADLADQLGNLVSRVGAMVMKYLDGIVPPPTAGSVLGGIARNVDARIEQEIARFQVHQALAAVWELVEACNRFVVEQAPWTLAGKDDERLRGVLGDLCAALRAIGKHLQPFLPETGREILRRISQEGEPVVPGPPLFPKH